MRVLHSWEKDSGRDDQLAVERGKFVYVWIGSETPHGWVYGEDLDDGSRAGWFPLAMLAGLPPHLRWMRAYTDVSAAVPGEMEVHEGAVLLINVAARTAGGWIWAELPDAKEVSSKPMLGPDSKKLGWVPVSCLEWL